MKTFRLTAAAVMTACALMLLGGAGTAAAQEPAFGKKVPVTGEAKNGRQFEGTFTIKRFVERAGQAFAVGTLRGELGNRDVVRRGVRMPAAIEVAPAAALAAAQPPLPTPGACQILNLRLGPINLNLLGLRIATNTIRLRIEAIPGPGNLLGNLLCAIANLLNPSANTPVTQLVQVLNALLALAPRTAGAA